MNTITVNNLCKSFGRYRNKALVLDDVSFSVKEGSITGFLGANGAGKTTTFKCILEFIRATSGNFSFFNQGPLNKRTRQDVGFLPERPYFYDYLTGEEFLTFYAKLGWKESIGSIESRVAWSLKTVKLTHARKKPLRSYSKGMLQRIGFAQAIIHRPKLIILDEPMAGLDPDGRSMIKDLIREVSNEGCTIFFSSHLLHDVENLCDDLVILKNGRMAFQGTISDFTKDIKMEYEIKTESETGTETITVDSLASANKKIAELISKKATIHSVHPKKKTLEEAFVTLSFDRDFKSSNGDNKN